MSATTIENTDTIRVCNSLLHGEISAIETYDQAIEKFATDPNVGTLIEIRGEHVQSAEDLRLHVTCMGGEPEVRSGAWGVFTKAIQATANFFGEGSAIDSLIQGEEHGRASYFDAVSNDSVEPSTKVFIGEQLVPRIESHVSRLNLLRQSV